MSDNRYIDAIQRDLESAEHSQRKLWVIYTVAVLAVVAVVGLSASIAFAHYQSAESKSAAEKKPFVPVRKASTAAQKPQAKSAQSAAVKPKAASKPKLAKTAEKTHADVKPKSTRVSKAAVKAQTFHIAIGDLGYEPSVVHASASRPVTLKVAKGEGCAEGFLIRKLGVNANNSKGATTVRLGRLAKGTYKFTCGMEMVEGKLVVD